MEVSEQAPPAVYSDDWRMRRSDSPGVSPGRAAQPTEGIRRVETVEEAPDEGKDYEKGATRSGAFL